MEVATLTSRPCPVCGSSDVRPRLEEDGASIGTCRSCKTLYTFKPCNTSTAEYFQNTYFRGDDHLSSTFGSYRAAAFGQFAAVLREHRSGGRILDIGCAAGDFLASLDGDVWERLGVEPSTIATERARSRGLSVVHGVFGAAPLPFTEFDAITMLDLLGHVEDPRSMLCAVASLLAADGVLLVEVPGATFRRIKNSGPLSKVLSGRWSRLNPRDYVFFPSTATIRRLLAGEGFELVAVHDVRPNLYGSRSRRRVHICYFHVVRAIGRATGGRLMLATKILYVARRRAA